MIHSEKKSNQPDAALARLAADGNAAAFDEIYSRHRSFVYNIALRMTGNSADAEDLTQESFVSVLRRVGERANTLVTSNRPVEDWGKLSVMPRP